MTIKHIELKDFQGRWALRREIRDNLGQQQGKLVGIAEFSVMDDGLLYMEQGKLSMGDQPDLNAERCYIWKGEGPDVEVLFEDGRPFHKFNLRRTMPDAQHLCGADMYSVAYRFIDWPNWTARWDVLGPRKDYRMISSYKRTV